MGNSLLTAFRYVILWHSIRRRGSSLMRAENTIQPIVVYVIERHPLEMTETGPLFRWIRMEAGLESDLEALIGPFDPDQMSLLIDHHPGGAQWQLLLESLLAEKIRMVITHLAPLSNAQRQQLIGVCDQMGSMLITPGDAGRNRKRSQSAA